MSTYSAKLKSSQRVTYATTSPLTAGYYFINSIPRTEIDEFGTKAGNTSSTKEVMQQLQKCRHFTQWNQYKVEGQKVMINYSSAFEATGASTTSQYWKKLHITMLQPMGN
ncbi:MAG: hypothetical protein U0T81_10295 [Saprospiraceae bacterium]